MNKAKEGTIDAKMIVEGLTIKGTKVAEWSVVQATRVCGMGTTSTFLLREGICIL